MEVSVQELLEGKSTIIKNKEFFPTKTYVEPFLENMSKYTSDFSVRVDTPSQMSTTGGETDIVYNRVWIQAIMPEDRMVDNHAEVYGLVYGIDVKKPVVKLYRGGLNMACTNLTIFSPEWLNVQELQPDEPINYNPLKQLLEKDDHMRIILNRLKNEHLVREDHKIHLGEWVNFSIVQYDERGFGKIQMASSTPITAYKQLFLDSDHKYYVPEGINPTKFDVYSAFTDIITHDKRDILNTADKTILLGRMLNVSVN